MPFAQQKTILHDYLRQVRRAAIDETGIGMQLAEGAAAAFPGRVEPVTLSAPRKETLAIGCKRHFEERKLRIPSDASIRRSINAVKKYTGPTGVARFDADRTQAGHADEFWALTLCVGAASEQPTSFKGAASLGTSMTGELAEMRF